MPTAGDAMLKQVEKLVADLERDLRGPPRRALDRVKQTLEALRRHEVGLGQVPAAERGALKQHLARARQHVEKLRPVAGTRLLREEADQLARLRGRQWRTRSGQFADLAGELRKDVPQSTIQEVLLIVLRQSTLQELADKKYFLDRLHRYNQGLPDDVETHYINEGGEDRPPSSSEGWLNRARH